jgi:hypothetical protein
MRVTQTEAIPVLMHLVHLVHVYESSPYYFFSIFKFFAKLKMEGGKTETKPKTKRVAAPKKVAKGPLAPLAPLVIKDARSAKTLSNRVEKTGAIIFYRMNGCGHCVYFDETVWKKCPPELMKMAAEVELSNIPLLPPALAHVDGSPIMGFPTIVFRHGKEEAVFAEERSVEKLMEFFNAHSHANVKAKGKGGGAAKEKK